MDLIVKVVQIKGTCPVYSVGDTFRLKDGYQLISDKPLCMHSLASLMPHYNALRISQAAKWGLGKEGKDAAYVQCLDPMEFTDGGTVVFEITKSK